MKDVLPELRRQKELDEKRRQAQLRQSVELFFLTGSIVLVVVAIGKVFW